MLFVITRPGCAFPIIPRNLHFLSAIADYSRYFLFVNDDCRRELSDRLKIDNLGGVIEAGDWRRRVREAAADHQPAVVDA